MKNEKLKKIIISKNKINMQNPNEHKRNVVVVDLTTDDEASDVQHVNKRVVISKEEDDEELCDGCEGPTEPNCGSFCRQCFDYTGHDETPHACHDDEEADDEEEDNNCCDICGSEYETRKETGDVCEKCYESVRNICHRCKEVKTDSKDMDEADEYCEGFCNKCYPYVLDILDPVVQLLKK